MTVSAITKHTWWAFALSLLVVSMVGVAVPSAEAADVSVDACRLPIVVSSDSSFGWRTFGGELDWKGNLPCSFQRTFDTSLSATRMTEAGWSLMMRQMEIKRVSFSYSGGTGEGARYTVGPCTTCGDSTEIVGRGPGEDPARMSVEMPPGVNVAQFRLSCVLDSCPPSADPLRLLNVVVVAGDSEPPWLASYRDDVRGPPLPGQMPMEWNRWNRLSQVRVDAEVFDHESGLSRPSIAIDDESPIEFEGRCDFEPPLDLALRGCPGSARFVDTAFGHRLTDGWHQISVSASDAVGNVMPTKTFRLGVDSVGPRTPAEAVAEVSGRSGWTAHGWTSVSWRNLGETTETATESGIAKACHTIESVDAPGSESAPVCTANSARIDSIRLPADGRWRINVNTVDAAGNVGGELPIEVGRDTDTPTAPALEPNPWVGRQMLIDGYFQSWSQPSSDQPVESGVCGHAVTVDDSSESTPPPVVDEAAGETTARLPAGLSGGTHFVHVRSMSCAGLWSPAASTSVAVDDLPPSVETSIPDSDSGAWRSLPQAVKVAATDGESGVAGVACRVDGGIAVTVPQDTTTLMLGSGVHEIECSAIDRVGNRSTALRRTLRVDVNPPTVGMTAGDTGSPTLLRAAAGDAESGVKTLAIEYRRVGFDADWNPLTDAASDVAYAEASASLVARIPDEKLPAGLYEFRAVAMDRAGNSSLDRAISEIATVTAELPLRLSTTISARIALYSKRCRLRSGALCRVDDCPRARRSRCRIENRLDRKSASGRKIVEFGQPAVLTGGLTTADGAPVAEARLKVFSSDRFAKPKLEAAIVTGADGAYEVRLSPGAWRRITVRYESDEFLLASERSADLVVRAGVEMRSAPKRVRSGSPIVFRGRLRSGALAVPLDGKILYLQRRTGSSWTDVAFGKTDLSGRFAFALPSKSPALHNGTNVFRARVVRESQWPFEEGFSRPTTLSVHGRRSR